MGSICAKPQNLPVAQKKATINKKIVVVGPSNVGKTTIIQQLIEGKSREDYEATAITQTYKKIYTGININDYIT